MADAVAKPPRVPRRRTGGPARRLPYLLIAPAGLLMLGFIAYPMLSVLYYSLQNYNVTKPWRNGYAGFDNFTRIFTDDPQFWDTPRLQRQMGRRRGAAAARARPRAGPAGQPDLRRPRPRPRPGLLALGGVRGADHHHLDAALQPLDRHQPLSRGRGHRQYGTSLLSDTGTVFWAAVVAELWRGVPFFAILILADLQSIPKDLYEAASVDGAGRVRRFFHITLPHLKDAIILSTLLRGVWEFNNVDLLYTLTGGGPAGQTTTLPLYVANTGIHDHDFGYASALTTVAFVILLFCSILYLRLSKFGGEASDHRTRRAGPRPAPARRPAAGPPAGSAGAGSTRACRAGRSICRWACTWCSRSSPSTGCCCSRCARPARPRWCPGRSPASTSRRSGTSAASGSSSRTA